MRDSPGCAFFLLVIAAIGCFLLFNAIDNGELANLSNGLVWVATPKAYELPQAGGPKAGSIAPTPTPAPTPLPDYRGSVVPDTGYETELRRIEEERQILFRRQYELNQRELNLNTREADIRDAEEQIEVREQAVSRREQKVEEREAQADFLIRILYGAVGLVLLCVVPAFVLLMAAWGSYRNARSKPRG